jgi:hypothetical protein
VADPDAPGQGTGVVDEDRGGRVPVRRGVEHDEAVVGPGDVDGVLEHRGHHAAQVVDRGPVPDRDHREIAHHEDSVSSTSVELDTQPTMAPCALIIASAAAWNSGK